MSSKQALVFGASGISGWSIARTCLKYPTPDTFSRVIACTLKPIEKKAFHLSNEDASRLEIHSGINLTTDVDKVTEKLKEIPDIEATTHVYYTAYAAHGSDFQTLKAANVGLLQTAVEAITLLCPNLEFWTLQSGGKAYGVEFYGQPGIEWIVPLTEKAPRIPEPYASNIFYYPQVDFLNSITTSTSWKFCEIRPDIIVGHTPHPNGMGLAQAVGIFLAMYKSVHGEGAEIVFPGNELTWKATHCDTSQDVLAKFHIFASLRPEDVSGKAFNVADEARVNWEGIWPALCQYFGLKGVGPRPGEEGSLRGVAWVMAQQGNWKNWVEENDLQDGFIEKASWEMMGLVFGYLIFDKEYDLSALRELGFKESTSTVGGYITAFERMRMAKIIP